MKKKKKKRKTGAPWKEPMGSFSHPSFYTTHPYPNTQRHTHLDDREGKERREKKGKEEEEEARGKRKEAWRAHLKLGSHFQGLRNLGKR